MSNEHEIEINDDIRKGVLDVFEEQLKSKDVEVSYALGSKKGDNYIGIVYCATGKPKSQNNENENNNRELKLIVKVAPLNAVRREQFRSRLCFLREIKMYSDVLPMMRDFQESCGVVPEENGFYQYAPCYKVIASDANESLVFRDLRQDDFLMFDRLQELTFDHVQLVMRALGKFHGISFALRDKDPEKLNQYNDLPEIFMQDMGRMQAFLDYIINGIAAALSDEKDRELLNKFESVYRENFTKEMLDCVRSETAGKYAVICHGDCWNNNILFRYDKKGVPVELRMLDFQLSRFASPATDICYYLFCCTSKKLRDQHYDDFINAYYQSVSEMISSLGSDPAELFPYEALQGQLKRCGKFGFLSAAVLLNLITAPSEDCLDMDEFAEAIENGEDLITNSMPSYTDVFKQRAREVAHDADRLGYI